MKKCTRCKINKSLSEFSKNNALLDGHTVYCKECSNKYNEENKEKISINKREYYEKNKEKIKQNRKDYRKNNIEKLKKKDRDYQKNNKERVNEYHKNFIKRKRETDPLFKLKINTRTLISNSIRNMNYTKRSKSQKILGISFDEFKIHIESLFVEGMSWDNYGEWHLDHKTPISWATSEEEVYDLNYYTNFQPLWAKDNMRKGNRHD